METKTKRKVLTALFACFAVSLTVSVAGMGFTAKADEEYFQGISMSLDENFALNAFVDASAGDGCYVVANAGDKSALLDGTSVSGGYRFSLDKITPEYMATTVQFELYNAQEELLESKETSIAQYLYNLLTASDATVGLTGTARTALNTLAVDILSYGAEAQKYLDPEVAQEDLATAVLSGLEVSGGSYALPETYAPEREQVGADTSVQPKSATFALGNRVELNLSFTAEESVSVDGAVVKVGDFTIPNGYYSLLQEGNVYTVNVPAPAYYLTSPVTAYLTYQGEALGYSLTYRLSDYVYKYNADATVGDLVKAVYNYGKSVDNYLECSTLRTATLTNATFDGDETTVELHAGESLPAITFDGANPYVVDSLGTSCALGRYVMPDENVSITLFADQETTRDGSGKQNFGTAVIGNDGTLGYGVNKYQGNPTTEGKTVIDMGGGEYEIATLYSLKDIPVGSGNDSGTGTGANFRVMTAYNRVSGRKYVYTYVLQNRGDSVLNFKIYKRNAGSDTSAVDYHDVLLQPGEFTTVEITWTSTVNNNNDLTYFKFMQEVDSGALAVSSRIRLVYVATLTNATFEGGSTTAERFSGESLPAVVFDGDNPFVVDSLGESRVLRNYVMPAQNVSITLFADQETTRDGFGKQNFGTAVIGNDGTLGDGVNNYQGTTTGQRKTVIDMGGGEYEIAMLYSLKNLSVDGGNDGTGTHANFRVMTAYNRLKDVAYRYTYTFKNCGSSALSFRVYKRNAGSDTTAVDYYDVSLQAGEFTTVEIIWISTTSNNNDLTYFKFTEAVSSGALAVSSRIGDPNGDESEYTVSLAGGATFTESGLTTAQLSMASALPEITYADSTEGKNLGWIVDDGSTQTYAEAESFLMPAKDITLTPCNTDQFNFSIAGGSALLDVWTENKKVGEDPTNGGAYISNRFLNLTNVSATLSGVMSVENDKAGTQMSINAQAGGYFRCMHAYFINGERTITYTFKNMGAQTAKFHLYQINSGTAPSEYVQEVELEAGASTTFSITFNYNNKTLIWLMTFDEAYQGNLWYSAEIVKP